MTALRAERADQLARKMGNRDIWQDHDLVFTNEIGEPFSVSAVGHAFKHILKKAGLPSSFRTHDLRHSAATYLTAAGVPTRTIMEILGHSTIMVTQRYQHVLDSMLEDAGSRLESFFPAQQHVQAS